MPALLLDCGAWSTRISALSPAPIWAPSALPKRHSLEGPNLQYAAGKCPGRRLMVFGLQPSWGQGKGKGREVVMGHEGWDGAWLSSSSPQVVVSIH